MQLHAGWDVWVAVGANPSCPRGACRGRMHAKSCAPLPIQPISRNFADVKLATMPSKHHAPTLNADLCHLVPGGVKKHERGHKIVRSVLSLRLQKHLCRRGRGRSRSSNRMLEVLPRRKSSLRARRSLRPSGSRCIFPHPTFLHVRPPKEQFSWLALPCHYHVLQIRRRPLHPFLIFLIFRETGKKILALVV